MTTPDDLSANHSNETPVSPESTDSGGFALPREAQSISLVSPDDEPLLALPQPAYQNLLVISTRLTPGRIESMLRTAGKHARNVGVVPVTAAPTEYDGPLWTTESVRPVDLTGLGIHVSQAARHLEPGRGWVLLDSLTMLLMYAESTRVHRFTNTMMRNLAARNIRGIYCLCPDAVPDQTVERFRSLGDTELDLRR